MKGSDTHAGRTRFRAIRMKKEPHPSRQTLLRQAEVFKALGHAGRMAIVHALKEGPVCACELAEVAGCSASTTSRHLSVLRHAGVIEDERRGQQIFYHLACPCVLSFADCINKVDAGEEQVILCEACAT
jgi:ArsR family transcriptional regulator